MADKTEHQTARDETASRADIRAVDDVTVNAPFFVTPDGYRIDNLEKTLYRPIRKRGQPEFDTQESFGNYVAAHVEAGTDIFVDVERARFEAVINGHQQGEAGLPGWGDHRAGFQMKETPEWVKWTGANNTWMKQAEFAEFLEENLSEVAEPDGADLIEVCTNLKARQTLAFHQGVKLSDGAVKFQYDEQIEGGSASKGDMKMPETFVLAIAPYRGSSLHRVEAKLRWRIGQDRQLALAYKLQRPHEAAEAAVQDAIDAVVAATKIQPLLGRRGGAPKATE